MKYKTFVVLCCAVLVVTSVNVNAGDLLRHNPFQQPEMFSDSSRIDAKASRNKMKLRGTVIDGDDSLVNIDGGFYRLNQKVAGYRVIRIKNASVTLRRGGNDMILTLNADE